MSIAVTGVSGFLGQAIAKALYERGHQVLSLGRTLPAEAQPASAEVGLPGKRIQPGIWHLDWDLSEPAPAHVLARAPRVEAVIHAAGTHDEWLTAPDAHTTQVTTTRNVLDAFPKARFIHVSCAYVYDPRQNLEDVYEESGPVELEHYTSELEKSLVAAEGVVARLKPQAIILRPAPVYVPGTSRGLEYFLDRIHKGVLRLPNGGNHLLTLCSMENVLAAVIASLKHAHVSGPVNVGDPEPYVLREALNTAFARADCEPVTFQDSAADLELIRAWWKERTAKLRGGLGSKGASRPAMSRFATRVLTHDRTLNLSRLHRLLGVSPTQGLARSQDTPGTQT